MRPTLPRLASIKHAPERQQWLRNVAAQTHDRVRTHVLSRDLCDESLRLLKPTLPEPGTCDVIDLNPGVCVWSEAVHDFLKPKRHVLVEKRRDLYSKYIDPLIAKPGSSYRYAPDLRTAVDRTNGFLSHEVMNAGTRPVDATDTDTEARRRVLENKHLLVIANLTHSAQSIPGFSGTEAKRFLNNFYRSLFAHNDYLHQYGLVRLLAWIDDRSRKVIVPTSVVSQTKQSLQLEAAFDVVPVAGPNSYLSSARHFHRWYQLDQENLKALYAAEEDAGIAISGARRPHGPSQPLQSYPPSTELLAKNRKLFPHSQRFIDDLLSVEERLAVEDPEWLHRFSRHQEKGALRPGQANHLIPNRNANHTLYRRLLNQLTTYHNNYAKVVEKVSHHRALWHRVCEAQQEECSGQGNNLAALRREYDALEEETRRLKKDNRVIIHKAIDDYRAYDCSPRAMSWNRRRFEPLLVTSDEFYPHRPLSLIDMTPRPHIVERLDTADKQICFDYVLTTLMAYTGDNVIQAVNRLIGHAPEEFLSQMPQLRNVKSGGWHDLQELRIRSLNWQFYVKLTETFERWPYREPTERLLSMGNSVFNKPI